MQKTICIGLGLAVLLAGCAGGGTAPTLTSAHESSMTTSAIEARAPAPPTAAQRKAEVVKVGLMLPLSGPGQAALIADTMRKAAELARTDARVPHVSLIVRDDKGTPDGAMAATQELLQSGVEVILGPLFSQSVRAAQPIAQSSAIPLLSFSNDRQVAGGNVTLVSFLVEPEVVRVMAYAAQQGKKRMASLVPDDAYGRQVDAALTGAAAQHGITIVARQTFPSEQANGAATAVMTLRDTLRGIEEHGDPVTALFVAGGEASMAMLTPQLKQAGIDTKRLQVLGTGALDYPTAGHDGVLAGAWFAAPDPKGWLDFAARYARANGHAPPRIAGLAYDAVIAAAALSNGPDGARYSAAHLTRASGFEGLDGVFRFKPDGTVERALAIHEVQASGSRVIDHPPRLPGLPTGAVPSATIASGVLSAIPSAFPPVN